MAYSLQHLVVIYRIAYCLLPTAYCLWPMAYSTLWSYAALRVKSRPPKLKPRSVEIVVPVIGALGRESMLRTGGSKVNIVFNVP